MIAFVLLSVGCALAAAAFWLRRWYMRYPIVVISAIVAAVGAYLWWYEHRTIPDEVEEPWFEGVTYRRVVRQEPRAMIVHIVAIDLNAAGIGFLVTPPVSTGVHPLRGQTTSGFVREHGLQVAINGSFFRPWHARGPFDYYPYVGDPVSVDGLAISNGRAYSQPKERHDTLFVAKDGRVLIGGDCPDAMQAISGQEVFLRDGVYCLNPVLAASYTTAEPRTAVALSKDERTLYLFVVDGRQPNYSEGATMKEMAELIREHGGWTALHLDGGGSSTLVRARPDGRPIIVNSPIHGRHPPGRERPVANHLGVFAKTL